MKVTGVLVTFRHFFLTPLSISSYFVTTLCLYPIPPSLDKKSQIVVANDVSIPRECFARISEFFKRNLLKAARIQFTMGFTMAKISKNLKSSFWALKLIYMSSYVTHIEGDQTKPVCFMREKNIILIKKTFINLKFMIFAVTIELHYNGKNLKYQIN